MRVRSKRRRVMRKFRIDEISAVTFPVQEHATADIIKSQEPQENDDMDFRKIGDDRVASFDSLEQAMAHLMDIHKCDKLTAMTQVGEQYPSLVEQYNNVGDMVAKAIAEANAPRRISKADADFEKCVTEIAARDRCSRLDALAKAPREFPDEYLRFQEVDYGPRT
jgi:hypothetical protein